MLGPKSYDPVTLDIIQNALIAIADEMFAAQRKTSMSPLIYEVLDLSTLNNKAYQTLSNAKKCLKYVLELKGVVETDEAYQLPQSFLMEMMDVNEVLMDLEFEPDAEKLEQVKRDVASIEEDLAKELNDLINQFDSNPEASDALLPSIKDNFYRQKYIDRIRERLVK
ncbi:MAG: Fe-S protein assembly co-chaperone HscB [Proteobacteria bacterium]|nr:MAG: Fe-S protein assembly co-chaperone HscB [Pseudomonadota bacterium]